MSLPLQKTSTLTPALCPPLLLAGPSSSHPPTQVLLDSSTQQPRLSPCGYPLALTQAGSPFLGPQQQPLYTTHDGAVLLREDGHPLLSADGRMLGLGPGGRLQHTDGTPCQVSGQHLHLSGSGLVRTSSTSECRACQGLGTRE